MTGREVIKCILNFTGKQGERQFILKDRLTTIGDDVDCSIRLLGEIDVYCLLEMSDDGITTLKNTTNNDNVHVNGQPVTQCVLNDEDEVVIGRTVFKYERQLDKIDQMPMKDDIREMAIRKKHFSMGSPMRRNEETVERSGTSRVNVTKENNASSGNVTPENNISAMQITPFNVSKKSNKSYSRLSNLNNSNERTSTPKSAIKKTSYAPIVEDITPISPSSSVRSSMLERREFTTRRSVKFNIDSASDDMFEDTNPNSSTNSMNDFCGTSPLIKTANPMTNDKSTMNVDGRRGSTFLEKISIVEQELKRRETDVEASTEVPTANGEVSPSVSNSIEYSFHDSSLENSETLQQELSSSSVTLQSKTSLTTELDDTILDSDNSKDNLKRTVFQSDIADFEDSCQTDQQSEDNIEQTGATLKSPSNSLCYVDGVKKLMTPNIQKTPRNDLTGVEELFKTPGNKSSSAKKSDDLGPLELTDSPDFTGVKQLVQTPKLRSSPKNDLSDVVGVKQLMATPQIQKSSQNDITNVTGVEELFQSPVEKNLSINILTETQDIIESPNMLSTEFLKKSDRFKVLDSPDFTGVKKLMQTPKPSSPKNDLPNTPGIKQLMATPQTRKSPKNEIANVTGVKRLFESPRETHLVSCNSDGPESQSKSYGLEPHSPDFTGVEKLMQTPKIRTSPKNDLSNIVGVKQLMATPKIQKSPKNDLTDTTGVQGLFKTPREKNLSTNNLMQTHGTESWSSEDPESGNKLNDSEPLEVTSSPDFTGVKKLMQTPKLRSSPKNDLSNIVGVKQLMATPQIQKSPKNDITNVTGVKGLFETPRGTNLLTRDIETFNLESQNKSDSLESLQPTNSPDFTDVEKSVKTPKSQSVHINDLSNMVGIKQLLTTPQIQKSHTNDVINVTNLKGLFETARAENLSTNSNLDYNEPQNNSDSLEDLAACHSVSCRDITVPINDNDPSDVAGTTKLNDTTHVKKLFKTPGQKKSPINDSTTDRRGFKCSFVSQKNNLVEASDLGNFFSTPKQGEYPATSLFQEFDSPIALPSNQSIVEKAEKQNMETLEDNKSIDECFNSLLSKKVIKTYGPSPSKVNESAFNVNVEKHIKTWIEDQKSFVSARSESEVTETLPELHDGSSGDDVSIPKDKKVVKKTKLKRKQDNSEIGTIEKSKKSRRDKKATQDDSHKTVDAELVAGSTRKKEDTEQEMDVGTGRDNTDQRTRRRRKNNGDPENNVDQKFEDINSSKKSKITRTLRGKKLDIIENSSERSQSVKNTRGTKEKPVEKEIEDASENETLSLENSDALKESTRGKRLKEIEKIKKENEKKNDENESVVESLRKTRSKTVTKQSDDTITPRKITRGRRAKNVTEVEAVESPKSNKTKTNDGEGKNEKENLNDKPLDTPGKRVVSVKNTRATRAKKLKELEDVETPKRNKTKTNDEEKKNEKENLNDKPLDTSGKRVVPVKNTRAARAKNVRELEDVETPKSNKTKMDHREEEDNEKENLDGHPSDNSGKRMEIVKNTRVGRAKNVNKLEAVKSPKNNKIKTDRRKKKDNEEENLNENPLDISGRQDETVKNTRARRAKKVNGELEYVEAPKINKTKRDNRKKKNDEKENVDGEPVETVKNTRARRARNVNGVEDIESKTAHREKKGNGKRSVNDEALGSPEKTTETLETIKGGRERRTKEKNEIEELEMSRDNKTKKKANAKEKQEVESLASLRTRRGRRAQEVIDIDTSDEIQNKRMRLNSKASETDDILEAAESPRRPTRVRKVKKPDDVEVSLPNEDDDHEGLDSKIKNTRTRRGGKQTKDEPIKLSEQETIQPRRRNLKTAKEDSNLQNPETSEPSHGSLSPKNTRRMRRLEHVTESKKSDNDDVSQEVKTRNKKSKKSSIEAEKVTNTKQTKRGIKKVEFTTSNSAEDLLTMTRSKRTRRI